MSRNAEVAQARWKVSGADARLRQARAGRILPRLRLESENGLIPDARGDIYNPPADTGSIGRLGPFNRTELQFVQPLYTFGQLSSLRQAARDGVEVEEAGLQQTRLDVAFEVKKLYYGALLAHDLLDLVRRISRELRERQAELSDVSLALSSRYKLELSLIELDRQEREADLQWRLASAALAWQAGLPESDSLALADPWLAPVEAAVPPLEHLAEDAVRRRPDWRMLQAGITAKASLRDAARSAYYPQIFLAGGLRYAIAPGRTDQHNPFVRDEFNYFNGGVFIGIRQSFEWGLLGAELDRASAEYRQLQAREESARQGMRLDVHRAYAEYAQADADLNAALQSRKLARQWLKEAQEEYEFDPGQLTELVTAFETWAQLEKKYFEAIYAFNVSVAALEKTAGGIELSN